VFAVFAYFTCARAANAQWARQTTLDVGATHLTRDDFADTGGGTVAGLWSRWSERVSLVASGAATRVSDGQSTGIALGSASYTVPVNRVRLEGGGTGTILGTTDYAPSSSWMAFGRAHLLGAGWGAWLGGSGGNVHVERTTFPATTGELGAWYRRGGQRVTLSAITVNTSTVSTLILSDESLVRAHDPVRYADVSLIGHGTWRRFEVDAIALSRHTWKGDLASVPAASVAGAWWMLPNVAIAAAAGRQLADPIRGTVRARYATVALRLSAERHGPVAPLRKPPMVSPGAASLIATPTGKGAAVLLVHAPGARSVELMSDLTGWEPKALDRKSGRWELRLTTQPGPHHVVVRIDGKAWIVPANLPRIDNEMGGTVGLIVIP